MIPISRKHPNRPSSTLLFAYKIQTLTSLVVVIVIMIHTRRWRMVVVVVVMVVTTRHSEHRHTREKKSSEPFPDNHPVLSSLEFHIVLQRKMPLADEM
jgi:hypothetical protein